MRFGEFQNVIDAATNIRIRDQGTNASDLVVSFNAAARPKHTDGKAKPRRTEANETFHLKDGFTAPEDQVPSARLVISDEVMDTKHL